MFYIFLRTLFTPTYDIILRDNNSDISIAEEILTSHIYMYKYYVIILTP